MAKLGMKPRDFWQYFDNSAKRSAMYSERHFFVYGCFAVLVPIAYVADILVAEPSYNTFVIRLSVLLLSTPLLLYPKLPHRLAGHFHLYWVFIVTYAFPFSFGLMLTMNAAYTNPASDVHLFWILQYIIALFFFIQLITNVALTIGLWISTCALMMTPLIFIESVNWVEIQRVLLYPISAYLTAIIFGSVANRNVHMLNAERIRTASAIGSNIAHELRTPSAGIRAIASGLNKHLDPLVDAYRKAKVQGIDVKPMRPNQSRMLEKGLSTIEQEIDFSNTVVDMLLINTSDQFFVGRTIEDFEIRPTIDESIFRYPFNNPEERRLIINDTNIDFSVSAPRLLVVHVLFNLLKNALYHVQRKGTGCITVTATIEDDGNYVIVHDTGPGIPKANQKRIFDRLYTTTESGQGAGIGLSFCKIVMESIGGQIVCESVEGEYTTFKLRFPKP